MSDYEKKERCLQRILATEDMKDSHFNVMSKEKFERFLMDVEDAKFNEKKTPLQYSRLKRFNIIEVCKPVKYFLPAEEIYDIIDAAHISIGHGGHDRLKNETAKKYANVTKEIINIYLSMCEVCQRKKRRGLVSKPILHTEMNSRCQVDLIDMQLQEDRGRKRKHV
ncbi:hypothetical protein ACJJTC_014988 [Scirpophaga incertulas]